jgi:NAD(P)-dependent dehydrogenase (short-subunit alcohol dehydrogenase family)
MGATPCICELLQSWLHLTRPEVEQEMLRQTPLRRLGEPRDLVGAAIFLASEASDFVTGQNLIVDGGVTLA